MSTESPIKIQSEHLKTVGKHSHKLLWGDEELMSSGDLETIEGIKAWFDSGMTLEDLKVGRMGEQERRSMLMPLLYKGHPKITFEYLDARELREKLMNDYKSKLDKNHSRYVFEAPKAGERVDDEVYRKTGWRFH